MISWIGQVVTMRNLQSGLRLMLPVTLMLMSAAFPAQAQEASASGLWQKLENGKPVVWVLVVERNGLFEGVIAKTFPAPGEAGTEICSKCTDDRKNAPVLGISFIRDMQRNGLKYENGNVLDPRDGKIYKAKMSVSADGQELTMRGYIGFSLLGKDETWYRLPDTSIAQLDPGIIAKYLPAQAVAVKPPPAVVKKGAAPAPVR